MQLQGKSSVFTLTGMKTKIFGTDSPEQREAKIRQLEEQITEAEQQVKDATAEAQYVLDMSVCLCHCTGVGEQA